MCPVICDHAPLLIFIRKEELGHNVCEHRGLWVKQMNKKQSRDEKQKTKKGEDAWLCPFLRRLS